MAKTTTVPAASFKARCLELMDRVRETRETYVITKHGKPAVEAARSAAPKGRTPVDCQIVATARTLGVPLATRDGRIIRYVEASGAGRAIDISK